MLRNLNDVMERARKLGKVTVAVAVAQDRDVLAAIKEAAAEGIVDAILVGDAGLIRPMASEIGLSDDTQIIHEPDADKAALIAVSLVSQGKAQVLMKGLINSSNFLKAALDRECGLRSGKILCHFAAFEIPGEKKLAFHTDGGMNIAPSLAEKKEILESALTTLHRMGIEKPNVAVLTANEQVNPKMPATLDAQALVKMGEEGQLPSCVIEGPIAMDVAASAEASKHKGISSKIAGQVDLFMVPNIEAGNMVGKTLVNYAKAKIAGMILGATHPIVMVSRSDSAEAKVHSIALASLTVPRLA